MAICATNGRTGCGVCTPRSRVVVAVVPGLSARAACSRQDGGRALSDWKSSASSCANSSSTIEELVSIILEEIQTRDRGYQPAVVSAALLLEVAMVSGLVAHADWLLPRGSAAWSADEMLDHLTAFTLFGARQRGGSPALVGRGWPLEATVVGCTDVYAVTRAGCSRAASHAANVTVGNVTGMGGSPPLTVRWCSRSDSSNAG